jgi:hypothetical protein
MRFRRPSAVVLGLVLILAAGLLAACDPKLIAGEGGNGGDDNNDDNDNPPQISNEAIAAGQVIALHMDLIQHALAEAGQFDSASALTPRSIFTSDCITSTTIDATYPYIDLSLNACVDTHGTEYRGKALLAPPIDETDGYLMAPYFDAADKIIATNESNPIYSHTMESGSLLFTFTRSSGNVSAVEVSNFLRHNIFTTIASFTYLNVHYTGSVGSFPDWPSAGGSIQASWDDVGAFTVQFTGSSQATFTLLGVNYLLNLSTGAVTLATS